MRVYADCGSYLHLQLFFDSLIVSSYSSEGSLLFFDLRNQAGFHYLKKSSIDFWEVIRCLYSIPCHVVCMHVVYHHTNTILLALNIVVLQGFQFPLLYFSLVRFLSSFLSKYKRSLKKIERKTMLLEDWAIAHLELSAFMAVLYTSCCVTNHQAFLLAHLLYFLTLYLSIVQLRALNLLFFTRFTRWGLT